MASDSTWMLWLSFNLWKGNEVKAVTENVKVRTDVRGCNYGYVRTSEGVVVIDTPQLPTRAVELREEAMAAGTVRFLINTEHHIDHIFGNHFFAEMCPVAGHEHIMDEFWTVSSEDPYAYMEEVVSKDDPQGMSIMPSKQDYVVNSPNITFSEHMKLYLGEHVFELIHTPGHTRGQIAVHVPQERIVFVGDTIFCECQTWFHSADPEAWLHSLGFLRTLDVDYIVPGHGPVCTKAYILKQSSFILEWLSAVAVGISRGWSREECIQRISFLDRFPVDIGQESSGPMVQQRSAARIYDFLQGKVPSFR
ncbi:MAG: MBL fold metallo-hydrolase [Desulfobacteraceae bacterium]|nr:MBL fold metallo-hydrolase [Desulfobacteraceae bacterium]